MIKPKDPEVVDEMRAAGTLPEESDKTGEQAEAGSEPNEAGSDPGGAKPKPRKRRGKKAGEEAAAETADDTMGETDDEAGSEDEEPGSADAKADTDATESGETSEGDISAIEAGADEIVGAGTGAAAAMAAQEASSGETGQSAAEEDGPEALRDEILNDDAEHSADHLDDHIDEPPQRNLAATALMVLVGILVVAGGTLWLAPRVAPHLPAGIARYLMPGEMQTEGQIAALKKDIASASAKTNGRIDKLDGRLASAEKAVKSVSDQLSGLPAATAAAQDAAKAASASTSEAVDVAHAASDQTKALSDRLDKLQSQVSKLSDNISSVNSALAGVKAGGGPATPAELSAAVASLNSRIDKISSSMATPKQMQDLKAQVASFGDRLNRIEASAADAEKIQKDALSKVSTAIRHAQLRSAIATLTSKLEGGDGYAATLDEIAKLTGAKTPPALSQHAEKGLATASDLSASFGPYAQAAIAADVQAKAGSGLTSQALGWLRAQVTGRPVTEQEGSSVGAITSRIAARVADGHLAQALAEAKSLPEDAQKAMKPWLDKLRARVEAQSVLNAWAAQLGVNG